MPARRGRRGDESEDDDGNGLGGRSRTGGRGETGESEPVVLEDAVCSFAGLRAGTGDVGDAGDEGLG